MGKINILTSGSRHTFPFALKYIVLVILGLIFITGSEAFGAVWYVDGNIASPGDGTTWANSFQTIQEAIDAATPPDDEIWVKA